MTENRSTATSGAHDLADDVARSGRNESAGLVRTARAIVRLARAHRRLEHVPTLGQVRAMAWFDGREPCSYLLDRDGELRARADGVRLRARARPARAVLHLPRPVRAGDGAGDDARRRRVRPARRLLSRSRIPGPGGPALHRAGLRALPLFCEECERRCARAHRDRPPRCRRWRQSWRALDRTASSEIARRYIRRLALEPYLGSRLAAGPLADDAVPADPLRPSDHRPGELFGPRHRSPRRGDEDPARRARGGGSCTGRARHRDREFG